MAETDRKTVYKPCPKCDGWLESKEKVLRQIVGRTFQETQIWRCTVCDNVVTVPSGFVS